MRRSLALVTIAAATLVAGCASDYASFYRETDHERMPRPVATEQVRVIAQASHLSTSWSELGVYESHAPTVKEAMDAAKSACGRAGADYFILSVEPYESRGVWKVDGLCAVETAAEPPARPR